MYVCVSIRYELLYTPKLQPLHSMKILWVGQACEEQLRCSLSPVLRVHHKAYLKHAVPEALHPFSTLVLRSTGLLLFSLFSSLAAQHNGGLQ